MHWHQYQEPFLCNPDTRNRNKFTPLLVAAKENHFEAMELLLQAGANPNTQDPLSGMTPLHLVVCKYHTQRRVPTCQVRISTIPAVNYNTVSDQADFPALLLYLSSNRNSNSNTQIQIRNHRNECQLSWVINFVFSGHLEPDGRRS